MTEENLHTDLAVKAEINLYYDLFIPENAGQNAPLLIAVHGYGAHKRYMMREARTVAPANFVIASLQAPYQHFRPTGDGYRIGFGWLTDYKAPESVLLHHNFLLEIIEKLTVRQLIDPDRIYLYGFSQSCALNFRFALTFPDVLRGIVGVCGGIPSDLDTSERYQPTGADVFYLYSTNDEFYPLEKYKGFEAKLREYLPNFESRSYDAPHLITEPMRGDIKAWLNDR